MNARNATHNTSAVNGSATPSASPGLPTYLHEPLGATVFQITLWSTIVFLGVIGNLLVCIAIIARSKMKTSMNYYLLSLAIADLGVLLVMYPVAVSKYLFPFRWLLGKDACLYLIPTEEIFYGSSIWSITAIAFERYRNVVGAKRYQIKYRSRDRVRTRLVIGTVWLVSFLVASVPLYPVMTYEPTLQICYSRWPDIAGTDAMYISYTVIIVFFWYVLPLGVIAFTYIKIKKGVHDSVKFRKTLTSHPLQPGKERRKKMILRQSQKARKILTPLVVLFAVTMFPLNALRIWLLIMPTFWMKPYYNLLMGQIALFIVINSSANPLVYYLTSNEFKEAFKRTLKNVKDDSFFKNISSKLRASRGSSYGTSKEESYRLTNNNTNNTNNTKNTQLELASLQFVSGL